MFNRKKQVLSGLTAAILLFLVMAFQPPAASAAPVPGTKLCAENQAYRLYVNEATLGVVLEDKATGLCYNATREDDDTSNKAWQGFAASGITVELYKDRSPTPIRADAKNGKPEIRVTYVDGGFDATLNYKDYKFSLSVLVRLEKDGFTANVPSGSIHEAGNFKISGIYLYPFFGATRLGEKEGYILVPEGAGALIDLKDNHGKYKSPYIKRIYGENVGVETAANMRSRYFAPKKPKIITMPVYGMSYTKEKSGFLAIAEQGAESAELQAYPNGVVTDYNWAAIRFIYREKYNRQVSRIAGLLTVEKNAYLRDISVRFITAAGEKSGYDGLAGLYRKYLLDKGKLVRRNDSFKMKLDLFGADTKKWLLFDVAVPMTTIKQAEEILSGLRNDGVEQMLAVYKGWQKEGLSRGYGSSDFRVNSRLGSLQELNAFADELKRSNTALFLEQNLLWAFTGRLYHTGYDIAKRVNQTLLEMPTYSHPYNSIYYLTPQRSLELAQRFAKQYKEASVGGYAISELPNNLFSFYKEGNTISRGETAAMQIKTLNAIPEGMRMLEQPFAYLWNNTDYYYDMPLSTSNYGYFSAEVPFLPIVLKGYIPYWAPYANFEPNEKQFFLKMIEYGAYPSFILTYEDASRLKDTNSSDIYSSQFSLLKEKVAGYYRELSDIFGKVEGADIQSHRILKENVVLVSYSNGVRILVNYSKASFTYQGVTVNAEAYACL